MQSKISKTDFCTTQSFPLSAKQDSKKKLGMQIHKVHQSLEFSHLFSLKSKKKKVKNTDSAVFQGILFGDTGIVKHFQKSEKKNALRVQNLFRHLMQNIHHISRDR